MAFNPSIDVNSTKTSGFSKPFQDNVKNRKCKVFSPVLRCRRYNL